MDKKKEIRKLEVYISTLEDKLSKYTTKLWKLVNPTPDEVDGAKDTLREHENNWEPTDLDILRNILKGDRVG